MVILSILLKGLYGLIEVDLQIWKNIVERALIHLKQDKFESILPSLFCLISVFILNQAAQQN